MRITKKKILISFSAILILYLLLLGLIYIIAPDPVVNDFPTGCRGDTPNCTRVADYNVRGEGLTPLLFNASMQDVHDAIASWIRSQPRSSILLDHPDFIHAKFLTFTMRFPDDFYAKLSCNNSQVLLWVQSQARLGQSDINVNEDRVQEFFTAMQAVDIPAGSCS